MKRQALGPAIELMRCVECGGLLLYPGMLERIRQTVRADEFFDIGHPKVGRALDAAAVSACPVCGGSMRSGAHPEQAHVRVEQCTACDALFLDAGELTDLSHDSMLERLWNLLVPRTAGN